MSYETKQRGNQKRQSIESASLHNQKATVKIGSTYQQQQIMQLQRQIGNQALGSTIQRFLGIGKKKKKNFESKDKKKGKRSESVDEMKGTHFERMDEMDYDYVDDKWKDDFLSVIDGTDTTAILDVMNKYEGSMEELERIPEVRLYKEYANNHQMLFDRLNKVERERWEKRAEEQESLINEQNARERWEREEGEKRERKRNKPRRR